MNAANYESPIARERQLWTMLGAVEEKAAHFYGRHATTVLTDEKRRVSDEVRKHGDILESLADTPLLNPLVDLLNSFEDTETFTLFVNGLVLEQLGATLYGHIARNAAMSDDGRRLAERAEQESIQARDRAAEIIRKKYPNETFEIFAKETGTILAKLDGLGEVVDTSFGPAFHMKFADVLGDLTSELLPVCVNLGMVRRKLVVHLANAFMTVA